MKIKSLQLKNFKRFTDLTLQDIPENAKLVLLIGSNGSGKSSVFDAFEAINKVLKSIDDIDDEEYYKKDKAEPYIINFYADNYEGKQFTSSTGSSISHRGNNTFYGRSAVRYFPRIERTVIGTPIKVSEDADRPGYYIDRDSRFENDIDLLLSEIVKKVFSDLNNKTNGKIDEVKKFIQRLNESLSRVFESNTYSQLELINFQTPADGKPAQLIFRKGNVEINYDLLSAGEKEIINLLINLYARASYFTNTIYFFDEIDAHLNTKLQYDLLKELTENWIPDNCQFWTASHSLGFIQYATEYKNGCIIDFDDLDFDHIQVLKPKSKENFEIFEIAVSKSFIDKAVQGRKIIFSENTDTPFYNDLALENVFFFVSNDKQDAFLKAKNHKHAALIDRDYLSDKEIDELKDTYPFLYFLPYYSIENLLFHPDNLQEIYKLKNENFDKEGYISSVVQIKNKEKDYLLLGILQARGGYPFFKENENAKKLKDFRENYRDIANLLRSDDFETFFKIFPAKDYGTEIKERQNISKIILTKTNWFKYQIEKIIQ
ncbi:MAG: AAA family ATPase [Ginsengibacter sp.]